MKSMLTRKVLIIVSVISVLVFGAIILAFTTGNTYYPSLSDPNGVFYQRVDAQGNVLYEITNADLYEEIKSNDGLQQLLLMTDSILLKNYINEVTDDEVADKILQLTYGTSDPDKIADISDDNKATLQTSFDQSMVLAGFQDNPEDYAKIIVAREKLVMSIARENDAVTDKEVATEYLNNYFEDLSAIKIRFTSENDAKAVEEKFNLVSLPDSGLREYNGYIYQDETLLDSSDKIVEAYTTVDTYYFDKDSNILNTNEEIIYTLGANDIYTDQDDLTYRINPTTHDLVNSSNETVISNTILFNTLEAAKTYKENNSEYYTVTRTDPFDMNETINVVNANDEIVFTIDSNKHIFDTSNTDVTYTTDLYVNKVFTAIGDVETVTTNNSVELTNDEVLQKYIEMYNYVYGIYRDTLPLGDTASQLADLNNEFLTFNFEKISANSAPLADYIFSTLSIANEFQYTITPTNLSSGASSYYYMVYKLTEPTKLDITKPMLDSIEETIVIPTTVGDTITLPETGFYDSTITWDSSDTDIISNQGTFVAPAVDTEVYLTYTINCFGKTRRNTFTINALANGQTVDVNVPTGNELTYRELVNNDTIFNSLQDKLYDNYVYGTDSDKTISTTLSEKRAELGFKINDYYLALDYKGVYSSYVIEGKGDKRVLASLDKTLTSDNPVQITADDFFKFALTKNAALYTLYATQFKELLNSSYFTEIFGTQTNLLRNKTDRMSQMNDNVTKAKQYYAYLQKLYAQYGMQFTYNSFSDYAYSQFKTKTDLELLQYYVKGELQPYLINETIKANDIIEALYPTVVENYENYFSLNVTHLLINLDFDEDGTPDNFNDYEASLTPVELTAFNALKASLETTVGEFEGDFSALITEYNNATREDPTWGIYKQNGFLMITEDLNITDKDDSTIKHSLTYSGDYGVKDKFVPEYTDALIALYKEYQLPQNVNLDELYSDFVETQFGLHIIKVTPGDDFDKPTFKFTEEDAANHVFSPGSENDNGAPTLAQLELYAQYKFYSMVYDLKDADVEETYGIDVPKLPTSVNKALETYFDKLLSGVYVVGVINVNMVDRLANGEFVNDDYSNYTNAELMVLLQEVGDIYFQAIFGDYITE